MSKVITVLGGNGYIGSRCIDFMLKHIKDIKIFSVSRSARVKYPQNKKDERVEIVKGDCLNPSTFEEVIRQSTGIIHSIGILFGNDEQYQKANKESCLRVAKMANENKNKVNFVYLSASRGIPFPLSLKYSGYIKSKRECEKELLHSFHNINPIILRPGFVKSKEKPMTIPIYYGVNSAEFFERKILNKISPNLGQKLELPSKGIELDVLTKWITAGALGMLMSDEIYSNDYMNIKENYEKLHFV
jgi:nucleoside-diphosphate-sugar epimerase